MKLLVVAHPDDETLFFAGLLAKYPLTKVLLVTDGNADRQGLERLNQFKKAMRAFKVKNFESLGFPDHYDQRLDIPKLVQAIHGSLKNDPAPSAVYTHGIIGEYGHPHHQDVSYAVHTLFKNHRKVFSCAYNAYPDLKIQLTAAQFQKKSKILTEIYSSETQRFLNLIPMTSCEGFVRVGYKEVEAIYQYMTARVKVLNPKGLKIYRAYGPHLNSHPPGAIRPRTF